EARAAGEVVREVGVGVPGDAGFPAVDFLERGAAGAGDAVVVAVEGGDGRGGGGAQRGPVARRDRRRAIGEEEIVEVPAAGQRELGAVGETVVDLARERLPPGVLLLVLEVP